MAYFKLQHLDLEAVRTIKFQSMTSQPNSCQLWQDDNNQVHPWLRERTIPPFQIVVLNTGKKGLKGSGKLWLKSSKTLSSHTGRASNYLQV